MIVALNEEKQINSELHNDMSVAYNNKYDVSEFNLGVRDERQTFNWRAADEGFSFLDKKTILILPGNATNSAKSANGMCKIVQNMLPSEIKDKFQICSLYYNQNNIPHETTVIEAQKLFDKYIIPLIATVDENGDLHRLSAPKAAHNMRNLVVFTHCYGSFVQKELDKLLNRTMDDLGYLEDEKNFIHKQLFVVHNNNIDENLGNESFGATNLYRIVAFDEYCTADKTPISSLRNYATINTADDEALYIKFSDNDAILLVDTVVSRIFNQHNGGYWQPSDIKSEAGLKEEDLFEAMFKEVVSSEYMISGQEQILNNVYADDSWAKKKFADAIDLGVEYKAQFDTYYLAKQKEFDELKRQIMQDNVSLLKLRHCSIDTAFWQDENDNFLMDYALKYKNYTVVGELANKMKKNIPVNLGKRFQVVPKNKNQIEAFKKQNLWAQEILNDGKADIFVKIADKNYILANIDFSKANEECLQKTADLLVESDMPKDYTECKIYLSVLLNIYANAKNANGVKKEIKDKIFARKLYSPILTDGAQEFVVEKATEMKLDSLLKEANDKWRKGRTFKAVFFHETER